MIFEMSLTSGIVPADWRHANVTPIHKKGPKGEASNYRPVSLTCIPCKIFESLLKDGLMEHLDNNKLIKPSQHGFAKGKSCATNLVMFLDKLTAIIDKGSPADVFYLDFAKAFDKVPTQRLLLKLKNKGVDGNVLRWIRNWLTDRSQEVKIGEARSDRTEVKSGVPQGSILGPPLFSVFIDDLDDYAEIIDMLIKFADDTKGLQEINSEEDRAKLQEALDNMVRWAREWGMEFNTAKCKIMNVGHNNPGYQYTMGGVVLQEVEEEKDVGVTVHRSLKPSRHCQKAAGMATGVLRQLAKNFHYRDRYTLASRPPCRRGRQGPRGGRPRPRRARPSPAH